MFNWCEWAAREVTQEVKVTPDRDGDHPHKTMCHCGLLVTPIKLMQYPSKWFYPAHQVGQFRKASG